MQIIEAKKLVIVSSIALINKDDNVLLAKRPKNKHLAGLWEFPGGKIKKNETAEHALIREIKEELNIDISNKCIAPISFSSFEYNTFNLILLLYICRRWEGTPRSMEKNDIIWIKPNEFKNYPMPPADGPLISSLQDLLQN